VKLRVGYRTFTLKPMPGAVQAATGDLGQFYEKQGEILVSPNQHPQEWADTLVHEVLHGLWYERDIGENPSEERAVRALAHGLVALVRDNPEFMKMLLDAIYQERIPVAFKEGRKAA